MRALSTTSSPLQHTGLSTASLIITLGHTLSFALGKTLPVVMRNFYDPEEGYVWSCSKWCEIVFPFNAGTNALPRNCDLILDLDVFKAPPTFPSQSIMLYLNGTRIGQEDITGQQMLAMPIPSVLLKRNDNSLVIDTPSSERPAIFGIEDDRILGVQLFSLQIQPA